MAFPVASRKADFVTCPRANQASGPQGQVAVISVSAVADYLDLTKGISQAPFDRSRGDDPTSMTRNYLAVECDVSLGIIFGKTAALVTGGNVPAIATTGSVSSGVYSGAAKTCFLIPANTPMRFMPQPGVDNFLGFVASGAGTMRVYQMSDDRA